MIDAKAIVKMAVSDGFDEAVAHMYMAKRSYLKIANAKVDSIVTKFENAASLFVSSKKRVFFTNIDKLEKNDVQKALGRAKQAMPLLQAKEDYNGLAEGPFKYKKANPPDKKVRDISTEEIADIAYAAINGALGKHATNVAGTVLVGYSEDELVTSNRAHASGSNSEVRLSLRAFKGTNFSFQDAVASSRLGEIDAEKTGGDAADMAMSADKTGRIENGTYDIIYMPSPGGSLLYMTNSMACIGNVETGSWFTGKLNKEVANKDITIYDEGDMKDSIDASPYDSEGYPTQRTTLVANSILASYLHNYSTAKKYKTKSTGNAGLVEPNPNVMHFRHNKKVASVDELVRNVHKGILVTNLWYTRFSNYLTGDFSTVPRDLALYIENGEIKFAIKQKNVGSIVGIRVSDNMIRMLKNIECAADDTKQASSWEAEGEYFFMPSILVREAKVTVA